MSETLFLIDAHAYIHRAFHALPPLTTSSGQPVQAVYGFVKMFQKIVKTYQPTYLVVCFDTAAPTFRHEMDANYKATRKEIDPSLIAQFPLAHEAVEAFGYTLIEKDGFEADDLIAELARQAQKKGIEVVIVSGDKDMLQLVSPGIKVLNEHKNIIFDREKVIERYGLAPEQLPDMFALIGDVADNVPGVKGIGEKTAVKLLQTHGTLDKLLAATDHTPKVATLLKTHEADAHHSRAMVVLDGSVPIEANWNECRVKPPEPTKVIQFLKKCEFRTLAAEFEQVGLTTSVPVPIADDPPCEYQTIQDAQQLASWLSEMARVGEVAVDVETTGLQSLHCQLVGVSLSYAKGRACYIPVGHQTLGEKQMRWEDVRGMLQKAFAIPSLKIFGHNMKFDFHVLQQHGLELPSFYADSMIASYVLNPSRNAHGLKDLTLDILGFSMTPIETLIGKGTKQISMADVSVAQAAPYACADADYSLCLAHTFLPQIAEKGLKELFEKVEMPLVRILAEMESTGMQLDKEYLETLSRDFFQKLTDLEKSIFEVAGETFNVNSPKQLSTILFERLKLPVIKKTKTGLSTDESVLQQLASKHPLPASLLEYREIQKLKSTYIDGLLEGMNPQTHRIHGQFNQTVAATGRLSSSQPNLQNIPIRSELGKKIRRSFIAKKGSVLVSADYSQIDLRALAHISEDPVLCEAFRKGEDIHLATACEIFHQTPGSITADQRRIAKSINFGIVYGISAYGLAQQLSISNEEAKNYIETYFKRYAGVKLWIEQILKEARDKGVVHTLLGRQRAIPEIHSTNQAVRGFAERTAMNTPIQGTSADIIKVAMIHVAKAHLEKQWTGSMLVQVHDELLFEIPEQEVSKTISIIRQLMEGAVPLRIPTIVDVKVGQNWTDMEKIKA